MAQGDKIKSHTVQDNIRTSPVKPGAVGEALLAAIHPSRVTPTTQFHVTGVQPAKEAS